VVRAGTGHGDIGRIESMTTPNGPTDEIAEAGGVMAAVDGSESADRALAWAVREAQARGVPLTIVHAYHWPSSGLGAMDAVGFLMDALEQDSRDILAAAEQRAREISPDVPVTTASRLGPPVPTLVGMAKGKELVVAGSRGLGGFTGLLLGSVGTGLVANAPCSVAIVRGDRMPAPGDPVVVGVDGAPTGEQVLTEGFRAAQRRGCPLVAVHSWQDPTADVRIARGRESAGDADSWQQAVSDALSERLAAVGAQFSSVHAEAITSQGRPAAALLEQAKTAQLVVVGTRGRGELKGMLLGSTSRAMVQHAACPVLVVRSAAAD
jgi:nucleotide-binding universal stress UspA family protein